MADTRLWVVVSGMQRGARSSGAKDGVDIYLLVAENVVTNAYVSLESHSATAHLEMGTRFLAAGEPVDIAVSPRTYTSSDATGITAIFRREEGAVHDAGISFLQSGGEREFADALGGGATWTLGAKTNIWTSTQFYDPPYSFENDCWRVHASTDSSTGKGNPPRFAMKTDGTPGTATYGTDGLLAVPPCEFAVQPNIPNVQSASPTLRATDSSDGVYFAKGYVRDLANNTTSGDGVLPGISTQAGVPAAAPVSRDATAAMQKAFDDCFLAGGGTVTVEQGKYAVKGLRLRSDTTLLLKSGAVLKASRNCDDYDILADDKVEPVPSEDFAPGVVWTCDRVEIASCTMKTGDDCVAGFDNEDVTVCSCSFNTACGAFRFGGRHVLVEDCRAWGPGEYPIRNSLPKADRISGSHGRPGVGRRTLLSLFTYYSDFTIKVRHDPGEITVRNCRVENAQRFLHYNFSGNETWQKNRPLHGIRFENVVATGLGMSLCAYGDKDAPLSLCLKGCRISFAMPQSELVRAAHVEPLTLDGVFVDGVDGTCDRSWGGVVEPSVRDVSGVEPGVVAADVPFRVNPI